jgi:hypothetical protein
MYINRSFVMHGADQLVIRILVNLTIIIMPVGRDHPRFYLTLAFRIPHHLLLNLI